MTAIPALDFLVSDELINGCRSVEGERVLVVSQYVFMNFGVHVGPGWVGVDGDGDATAQHDVFTCSVLSRN